MKPFGKFLGDGAWNTVFPFDVGRAKHMRAKTHAERVLVVIALPDVMSGCRAGLFVSKFVHGHPKLS